MSNEANHLSELIDVCRPHADDLGLPDLRELAAAVQEDPAVALRLQKSARIDSVIGEAVRDVPVPAGLEERLLAAVNSASPSNRAPSSRAPSSRAPTSDSQRHDLLSDAAPLSTAAPAPPAVRTSLRGSWYRSRRVWGSVAACAATIVAAIFLAREPALRFDSQEDVAANSQRWLDNLTASQWSDAALPESQYPLPAQPKFRPYRWKQVAGNAASEGVVCYNISQSLPPTQLLFVCRTIRSQGLPSAPPRKPLESSPGWWVGGWQPTNSTGVVYILAVKGDSLRYQGFLPKNSTLAAARRALHKV